MVLSSCTVVLSKRYRVFLLTNISSSSSVACGISRMEKPLVYHGLSMSIQNKALTVTFLLVSKQRLKTTPTFALEKQTRLERKQTRFILTLPVAGAVYMLTETYDFGRL